MDGWELSCRRCSMMSVDDMEEVYGGEEASSLPLVPVPFIITLPLRGVSQGGLRYWRAGFGDKLDDDLFFDGRR
ncbi:hypothetical protein U9M48_018783 [Paspalum notatum var. saurae]|uniref:Uncharacterized protein n=1 Tax=Paspalum notatum var. saurae TaxID=547442 RepID=A0AAQ3WQV2_PASNO